MIRVRAASLLSLVHLARACRELGGLRVSEVRGLDFNAVRSIILPSVKFGGVEDVQR
jgi:hypothetical protein